MDRNALRVSFTSILVVTALTGCASTQRTSAPPAHRSDAGDLEEPASVEEDRASSRARGPSTEEGLTTTSPPSPSLSAKSAPPATESPAPREEVTPEPPTSEALEAEAPVIEFDAVRFAYDSARLDAEARRRLGELAAHLRAHPRLQVTLEGHCDERGTEAYNLALGHLRADAMRAFLIDRGVEEGRIWAVSYGEERPAVYDEGPEAWAQNRRGEVVLTAEGEATAQAGSPR